ncbi:glycoside hydrolase superfamily [Tricladium varicosporioides]|nr:glycoside hydrolase superfamily [Hymenoscyphus varicosporioides]
MRFSATFLAAGLTAFALAAPIAEQDEYDECDWEPEASTAATSAPTILSTIKPSVSTPIVVPTSTSAADGAGSSSEATINTAPSTLTFATSVTIATGASSTPSSTLTTSVSAAAPNTLVASTSSSAVVKTSATSSAAAATGSSSGKLKWFGVNQSGAEFGSGNIPGTLGTDYTWPSTSSIGTLMGTGMNAFRIPFLMERLARGTMTSALDATYLASLKTVVSYITDKGGYAIVDPHNFGRYAGSIFTSTSDFQTFWKNVASEFATNDNVIFDCNNEFHDEPSNALVASLNQACIDGIRAAGATSQYIFVEGTSYTGAWTWTTSGNSDSMVNLIDSSNKIVYEMHQYLDSDGSGTSATCVSTTIGAERIAAATAWLKANNKVGIIGEFAGGANTACETAVTGMLDALVASSDVWMGALWWGGGPWWGDYIFSMEPPSGTAYTAYIDLLTKYA